MNEAPRSRVSSGHGGHGGHGWMMIICCIPMLVIAVALVATGVAGIGFLFVALMCTAMMVAMMRAMDHGSGSDTETTTEADFHRHTRHPAP
jgi:hypothetical protein